MGTPYLSRFTPSMMSADILEAVFVQREPLAERLVELIEDSASTRSKHHTLLIGPRGIGKTHLVSLIYHRIRSSSVTREGQLLIAWLREEEWGVMSFLDLLLRIHRALISEYQDEELEQKIEELFKMDAVQAERTATELLLDFVKSRTLLLIIENLDDLFAGLEEEGQMRFRSFIQENPSFTILAASQSLFGGVSLQTSPFYGFFRIVHLDELSIEDATRLVKKIAELNGDDDLADFIETPLGNARIKVLHRLAGGNHRVYIIFSEFLTREAFNELIESMMRTLDELTPYYQERIRWLSPQQRKIVELMCDRGNALSVKEIAARSFMTHQTASGQLKILREMGYVKANPIGRESFYELREPLMRLCVEVKKHRDKPIRLVVDLLRSWYTTEQLRVRLDDLPVVENADPKSEREHILGALVQYQSAETIFALSNSDRIREAMIQLLNKGDDKRQTNVLIIAEAVKKMSYMIMSRYRYEKNWALSHEEDVAQTALVKILELIKYSPEKIETVNNVAAYLYSIVRFTASGFWKIHAKHSGLGISGQKLRDPEINYEHIIDQTSSSPQSMLELRTDLLQKTQSYLLEDSIKVGTLKKRINDLEIELRAAGANDVFNESLIRCSLYLSEEAWQEQNLSRFRKWDRLIKEQLQGSEGVEMVLRVISKIIKFTETRDRRVLLELPLEERTFLEPLIKAEN